MCFNDLGGKETDYMLAKVTSQKQKLGLTKYMRRRITSNRTLQD